MRVLSARGIEREASIPFAGLLELLRPVLEHVEHLPAPQAAALRAALALGPGVGGERLVIGAATLGVLAAAAEERPLCVLIDDAHRLDEPSAEAILFAARRLLADPVAIIVGVRSGEASPFADAGSARARADRARPRRRRGAARARARGRSVPDGSAERLFRATGGNPLALIELAGEAESVAASLVDGPLPIATTLERAFAGRVARLSDDGSALAARRRGRRDGRARPDRAGAPGLGIDIAALQEAEAAGLVRRRRRPHRVPPPARPLGRAQRGRAGRAPRRPRARSRGADATSATPTSAPGTSARRRSARTTPPPMRSPHAAARARERGAYAAAALTAERAARLSATDDARGRRLLEAASNAWVAGSGERAVDLLDEAAPLAADDDVAVEIASLRGHVALAPRRCHGRARDLRRTPRSRAATTGDERRCCWAEAAYASLLRRTRRADARGCPRRRAPRCRRSDDGVEACTARLALGMALVFSGAGDEGPRAMRAAIAMPGYGQLLDAARRSCGAGRSRRRSSCASRARRASRSGARSPRRAIAASRGALLAALPARARRGHDRSLARGAGALLRGGRARRTTPGSRARSARRSRDWPGSRRARGARRAAAPTRARRSRWRAVRPRPLRGLGARRAGRPRARARPARRGRRAPDRHDHRARSASASPTSTSHPLPSSPRRSCNAGAARRPPPVSAAYRRARVREGPAVGARARGARRGARRGRRRVRRPGSSRRCAGTTPRPTRSSARAPSSPTASACGARAAASDARAHLRAAYAALPPARRRAVGRARAARARGDRRDGAQARSEHARPAHAARAADRARPRRRPDDPRGRRQALSQPEDDRVPPAQRLPQARHRLARRARRGIRAVPSRACACLRPQAALRPRCRQPGER